MDETGISCQERLEHRARYEVAMHGNPYRAAEYAGVSSAHFHNVLNEGKDSPTLRRKWKINKTDRRRFCCEDPGGMLTTRFDNRRRRMLRNEYLEHLMDVDEEYTLISDYLGSVELHRLIFDARIEQSKLSGRAARDEL